MSQNDDLISRQDAIDALDCIIGGVILGMMIVFGAFAVTKPLVDLIIPQSEIDKIDALGRWAKKELEQREAERREE